LLWSHGRIILIFTFYPLLASISSCWKEGTCSRHCTLPFVFDQLLHVASAMSVKVSEIVGLDPEASNPVMLLNMYKYLWQLFGAKGFRAKDQTFPAMECDGANVVFVAGEKQLYRGYIGGLDVDGTTLRAAKRPAEEQLRTYVAKRNRVTGQMRLVEVESCQLGNVSHDRSLEEMGSQEPPDVRTLRKMQLKYDSKASQALMRRIQSQSFDLGIVEQKLRQTIADCAVQDEGAAETATAEPKAGGDELQLAKVEAEICAKANPQARHLAELYRADTLIGPDVFRRLTEAAQQLLQTAPEELSMANEYLETRVKALMQSADVTSAKTLNHARICLYMDVLARLLGRQTGRAEARGSSMSPFTPVLDEPIRKQFMQYRFLHTRDRPTVTKYTRDKAMMYYLALAFVLEGQPLVPTKVVHQSLKVSKQELISFARAIGASYNPKMDKFSIGKGGKPRSEDMDLIRAIESGGRRSGRR
uniref:Uncharacterized protein n=2 Tax=Anopheles atroparvus TaxID=41427 RepID=A0A182J0X0_ANOAO